MPREAVALPDEGRLAMGRRGRALVAERYAWEHVAADMRAVYAWMLEKGKAPECLRSNAHRHSNLKENA